MELSAEWPRDALHVRSEDWHLEGATPAVAGIFGPGSAIHVENRVWRVTADLTALTPDRWRAVRAVLDRARGRYGVIRVPVIVAPPRRDLPLRRWLLGNRTIGGRAFAVAQLGEPSLAYGTSTPTPVVERHAEAGATELLLSVGPSIVEIGAMFSLPGDRVYRVTGRTGAKLTVEPPLRHAARVGDLAEFYRPWARMRLDLDDARLSRGPASVTRAAQLPLVEAFA
jgi:hypothetical protein